MSIFDISNLSIALPSISSLSTDIFNNPMYIVILLILIFVVAFLVYFYFKKSRQGFNANLEQTDNDIPTNKNATLMIFTVDWCPHCKTAMPEWNSMKDEYNNTIINGYTVTFKEYNCTEETSEIEEVMEKYKIEGYPTIKLLKDNQVIEYDAKPTKTTLETFLNTVL